MGSVVSLLFGGGAASIESESSQVLTFSSSARWQLHFNEIKESSKLVCVSIRFILSD